MQTTAVPPTGQDRPAVGSADQLAEAEMEPVSLQPLLAPAWAMASALGQLLLTGQPCSDLQVEEHLQGSCPWLPGRAPLRTVSVTFIYI